MMSQKAHTKCKRVVFCLLPLYDKPQNNNVEVAGFNLIPKQKKGGGKRPFYTIGTRGVCRRRSSMGIGHGLAGAGESLIFRHIQHDQPVQQHRPRLSLSGRDGVGGGGAA